MPTDTSDPTETDTVIAAFLKGVAAQSSGEGLVPGKWSDGDWERLFAFTSVRTVRDGDALIQRGDPDRTLYFVLRGELEVVFPLGDGQSLAPLTRISAGSVIGEQSFFDRQKRSASVWAVGNCDVAALTPDQYEVFAKANPALARDLLFALGAILAMRLRRTTTRIFE